MDAALLRLIETWDVLKSDPACGCICIFGLIETWDVLKYTAEAAEEAEYAD